MPFFTRRASLPPHPPPSPCTKPKPKPQPQPEPKPEPEHPSPTLTLIPTTIENVTNHDFVTPQKSLDLLKQRALELSRTYILRQTLPGIETLTSAADYISTTYYIKTNYYSSGGKSKKPFMTIRRSDRSTNNNDIKGGGGGGQDITLAEIRLDGQNTNIFYTPTNTIQSLTLEDIFIQRHSCRITGTTHHWQLLGPSRSVLMLTNERGERVALFAYANVTGVRLPSAGREIGEIHIIRDMGDGNGRVEGVGGVSATEEVLCSAVALVGAARGRGMAGGRR